MSKKDRIPEKVVQHQIASFLRAIGGAVYTVGTRRPRGDYQGTRQTPGIPDVIAFVPNRRALTASNCCPEDGMPGAGGAPALTDADASFLLLFVEAKAEGGRLSDAQLAFRDHCLRAGVGHVVGNLNAVIAWLLEAGVIRETQVPHYRLPAATGVHA